MKRLALFMALLGCTSWISGQTSTDSLSYQLETAATAGGGDFAPLWFSANRYGLSSVQPNSVWLSAGMRYDKKMKHHWKLQTGIELAIGYGLTQEFIQCPIILEVENCYGPEQYDITFQ